MNALATSRIPLDAANGDTAPTAPKNLRRAAPEQDVIAPQDYAAVAQADLEPHRAFKGILLGVLMGAACWGLIIAAFVLW